jgi:hypothetical protein
VQRRLGVPAADRLQVVLLPEVELVDDVAGVERGNQALPAHLHVVVEVGVAADVEIAGDFLNGEGANQSAPVLVADGLSHCLHLLEAALLAQQLEVAAVQVVAVPVQPPFLH